MANRMPRRLVALSMSAIAAIYVTGYLATQGADIRFNATAPAPVPIAAAAAPAPANAPARVGSMPPAIQQPSQGQPSVGQAPSTRRGPPGRAAVGQAPAPPVAGQPAAPGTTAPAASSSAPAAPSGAAVAYQDGTFTGSGDSRRGGVTVAVTIQGGKIADVAFTRVWTQYPVSRIAALPAQVVARQSAQVDRVSGATYNVQAFQQAVQQALAHAQAPAAASGQNGGGA